MPDQTRTHTPPRRNPDGSTTRTIQRACSGCGRELGDATNAEMARAVAGLPSQDTTAECGCGNAPAQTARLTDAELREIAAAEDWTLADPRPLVAELLELRRRVPALEAELGKRNELTTDEVARIHRSLIDDARSQMTADDDSDERRNNLWMSGYSEGVEHGLETVRLRLDLGVAVRNNLIRRARTRLAEVIADGRAGNRPPMINASQIDLLLDPTWDPNAHQCAPAPAAPEADHG